MSEDQVRQAFREQAEWCRKLGSPFTAMLCDTLAVCLAPTTRFARRILGWQGHPQRDALALRAAGALHDLARSGMALGLSSVYPPYAFSDVDAWWEAARDAIAAHDDRLHDFP
jgi:hypothetical protein